MRTKVCLLLAIVVVSAGCPPERCAGCDPRAAAIQFERVSTMTPTSGMVRITGVVTNWGQSPFVSGQGQQSVLLYEGGDLVAQQPFTNLAVDASVEVVYEREWSTQDEFRPPLYTMMLSYDPDIFIDGNASNDDCNLDNNDRSRSTSGLDALFEL